MTPTCLTNLSEVTRHWLLETGSATLPMFSVPWQWAKILELERELSATKHMLTFERELTKIRQRNFRELVTKKGDPHERSEKA